MSARMYIFSPFLSLSLYIYIYICVCVMCPIHTHTHTHHTHTHTYIYIYIYICIMQILDLSLMSQLHSTIDSFLLWSKASHALNCLSYKIHDPSEIRHVIFVIRMGDICSVLQYVVTDSDLIEMHGKRQSLPNSGYHWSKYLYGQTLLQESTSICLASKVNDRRSGRVKNEQS